MPAVATAADQARVKHAAWRHPQRLEGQAIVAESNSGIFVGRNGGD